MQFLLKELPSKMVVFYQDLFLQNWASAKTATRKNQKNGPQECSNWQRRKKNIIQQKGRNRKTCGQDFLGYRPPKSFNSRRIHETELAITSLGYPIFSAGSQ